MKNYIYILIVIAFGTGAALVVRNQTCSGGESTSCTSEGRQATNSNTATATAVPVGLVESGQIQWISVEQLAEAQKKDPRKVFVDIYTDWCGWCKVMDKETFKNPQVVDYVTQNYYAVKFNAEQLQDINFNGKNYSFQPGGRGGVHEFAVMLTGGKLSYPTTAFLDENLDLITAVPGYHKPDFFSKVLAYFGEDYYKTVSWESYEGTQ